MQHVLSEIIDHVKPLKQLQHLLVQGTDEKTTIIGCENMVVAFCAELKTPLPELVGKFGISDLSLLNGLLNFPSYKTDESRVEVVRGGKENQPVELVFIDSENQPAYHRLVSARYVPTVQLYEVDNWTIDISPNISKIKEFIDIARLYSSEDEMFDIKLVKNELRFALGQSDAACNRTHRVIERDINTPIFEDFSIGLRSLLPVLSAMYPNEIKMRLVSNKSESLLELELETDIAVYKYTFPKRSRG